MECYTGVLLARIKLYLQICTPTVIKTLPAWFLLNYNFSAYYIISMFNCFVKFWQHPKINPGWSAPRSSKKQSRGRIISNFTKEETFSYLISSKLSFCHVVPLCFIIAPFQKRLFSSPFNLGKKIIYLETQLKGQFTDLFWKSPGCSLFPQAE